MYSSTALFFCSYEYIPFSLLSPGKCLHPLTTDGDLAVSVIVPVGLKYSMPNKDVPLDFYLRVSPGFQVLPELDFVWGANLAVLWRFN